VQKVCECKTVYAADAEKCPHCGGAEFEYDHPETVLVGEPGPELDVDEGQVVKPKK